MAVDLGVEFAGLRFKNPFILAAAPPTSTKPGSLIKAARAGWGGVIMRGIREKDAGGNLVIVGRQFITRETKYIDKPPVYYALQNISALRDMDALIKSPEIDLDKDELKQAKAEGMKIGVMTVGPNPQRAVNAEKAGADFIELNMGAVYMSAMAKELRNPEVLAARVKALKQSCSIPVIVKISAALLPDELMETAQIIEGAGADGISLTNTLPAFIGVDIETSLPICTIVEEGKVRGIVSGLSGPAVKPLALRGVLQVAQSVDLPIMGIGGISDWESAVEFIMLGASTVQICTAVMAYGYGMIKELTQGLEEFMTRKGYNSINDFRGITTNNYLIKGYRSTPVEQPLKMVVDETKCNGCGRCMPACEASALSAITVSDFVARIDYALCVQCRMCQLVCPQGAISVTGLPV